MNKSLPSLNTLRAFEAVARHLSYQSAAAELNVSPAAVKQLVSKLEDSIGVALLERAGRGLALTDHGAAGLEDLSTAMQYMQIAVQKLREPQQPKQLIITVESSFAVAWLVPKLAEFSSLYPAYSVLIDSSPQIVDLERSHIDIAIRYGVTPTANLISQRLFDDHIFPVCSPVLADKLENLNDLNSVPLIHWDMLQLKWALASQWFHWQYWLDHIGASEVQVTGGLHFSDYAQALQAAIAGQGVILASGPVLKDSLQSGLLIAPFKESLMPEVGYDVVTTQQAAEQQPVKDFLNWVMAQI